MKHIYRSEILKKDFDTEEACAAAEKEFIEKEKARRKAEEAKIKEQEAIKKNIADLSKSVDEAYGVYLAKLHEYQKAYDDYKLKYKGSYVPRHDLFALGRLIDELLN